MVRFIINFFGTLSIIALIIYFIFWGEMNILACTLITIVIVYCLYCVWEYRTYMNGKSFPF